jgi:hypothetical protein
MTREISQIARATTVGRSPDPKATMIHEEGRTARPLVGSIQF